MLTNKKQLAIVITLVILSALLSFVFTYKCYYNIKKVKDSVFGSKKEEKKEEKDEFEFMHVDSEKISSLAKIEDEKNAWYTKYHFIAHAGGGIDGKMYSNSLEAWNLSYKNGNRVFDADLMFTTDDKLIVRHAVNDNIELSKVIHMKSQTNIDQNGLYRYYNSDENMSYDEYMSKKIYNKYTPLSCENLIDYMVEHPDLYISVDMKDDKYKSFKYFVDLVKSKHADSILDRIIINIHGESELKTINSVYKFKNIVMRQHAVHPLNYYEMLELCVKYNIHVVNVSQIFMSDEEIKMMKEMGIHIYVAVVDYISDMQYYQYLGVDGAVTDYLYESDWKRIENMYTVKYREKVVNNEE